MMLRFLSATADRNNRALRYKGVGGRRRSRRPPTPFQ
jgi:hypothetical protein